MSLKPINSSDPAAAHYVGEVRELRRRITSIYLESSFKGQLFDCRLRSSRYWFYKDPATGEERTFFRTQEGCFLTPDFHPVTLRDQVLAGASPRVQFKVDFPKPSVKGRQDLLDEITETIHTTVSSFDYNGLLPFNKLIAQLAEGRRWDQVVIDSQDEERGSTCVGMSLTVLQELKARHGVEGMFASQRRVESEAFSHAAVIIECRDGYLLIDPRSCHLNRIFSFPFQSKVSIRGSTFQVGKQGSNRPIFEENSEGEFEYCTHIANGPDAVLKHFMMEMYPDFPVSAYFPNGDGSKTLWISPLKRKITLKNMTVPKSSKERTVLLTFDQVLEGRANASLQRLYRVGNPSFHIRLDEIEAHLIRFVRNSASIAELFRRVN